MSSDVATVLAKLDALAAERRAQVNDKFAAASSWLQTAAAQIAGAVQQLRPLVHWRRHLPTDSSSHAADFCFQSLRTFLILILNFSRSLLN